MKFLAEAIVSFFDLLEAEGRALRRGAVGVCFAAVLLLVGGAFVVTGFLLAIAGLHSVIARIYSTTTAFFATAVATFAAAALFFRLGFHAAERGQKQREVPDDEGEARDGDRSGQEPPAPCDSGR